MKTDLYVSVSAETKLPAAQAIEGWVTAASGGGGFVPAALRAEVLTAAMAIWPMEARAAALFGELARAEEEANARAGDCWPDNPAGITVTPLVGQTESGRARLDGLLLSYGTGRSQPWIDLPLTGGLKVTVGVTITGLLTDVEGEVAAAAQRCWAWRLEPLGISLVEENVQVLAAYPAGQGIQHPSNEDITNRDAAYGAWTGPQDGRSDRAQDYTWEDPAGGWHAAVIEWLVEEQLVA